MKTPTLYLLCGPSCGDKSTFLDVLQTELGVEEISLDAINARRGYQIGDARVTDSIWAEALDVALFEVITAGMSGQSVVVNEPLSLRRQRDRYRENGKGAGMNVVLLRLDADRSTSEWPTTEESPVDVTTIDLQKSWLLAEKKRLKI